MCLLCAGLYSSCGEDCSSRTVRKIHHFCHPVRKDNIPQEQKLLNFSSSLPHLPLPPAAPVLSLSLCLSLPLPLPLSPSASLSFQLSLSLSRYDVELFQRIEQLIGKRLPLYLTVEEEVMVLMERVSEAQRHAKMVHYGKTVRGGRRDMLSVIFHWSSPQELQSSMENSKRKRKFKEDEEEEGEEKPRTKKRKPAKHS